MLTQSNLNNKAKNHLWGKAVKTANAIKNLTISNVHPIPPYTRFVRKHLKLYDKLIEFGRIGYVTVPNKLQKNWSPCTKAFTMLETNNETSGLFLLSNIVIIKKLK